MRKLHKVERSIDDDWALLKLSQFIQTSSTKFSETKNIEKTVFDVKKHKKLKKVMKYFCFLCVLILRNLEFLVKRWEIDFYWPTLAALTYWASPMLAYHGDPSLHIERECLAVFTFAKLGCFVKQNYYFLSLLLKF